MGANLVVRKNFPVSRQMNEAIKGAYRVAGNRSESEFIRDAVEARLGAVEKGEITPAARSGAREAVTA